MKVDREKYLFLDKSDLEQFVASLKDIEKETLIKCLDESIDDGLYDVYLNKIKDLEQTVEDYQNFIEEIRKRILEKRWDADVVLQKIGELSL